VEEDKGNYIMNFDDFKNKVEEGGLNPSNFFDEFKETGTLSEDSISALVGLGIEKEDLEALLENAKKDFDEEEDQTPKEPKVIHTTCPLPMEVLKQYFEDKDNTSFKINYRGGKLDANALMIYLSNLNLNADFDEETYNDRDALKELVGAYMSTTTALVDIEQLAREALAICCQHRDVQRHDFFVPEEEEFEEEEDQADHFRYFERLNCAKDFIEENLDIVERWCTMLDSSIVYNMSLLKIHLKQLMIQIMSELTMFIVILMNGLEFILAQFQIVTRIQNKILLNILATNLMNIVLKGTICSTTLIMKIMY
jgi:hypothetical protein